MLSDAKARRAYDARRLLRLAPPLDRLMNIAEDPAARARMVSRIVQGLNKLSQRAQGNDGHDLLLPWDLTFAQSYTGAEIKFSYSRPLRCGECDGTGFRTHHACDVCGGAGRLTVRAVPGLTKRCPRCGGHGVAGTGRCGNCRGRGLLRTTSHATARIPAGVANGTRLRLKGHGVAGRFGGRDGDLIVRLDVEGSLQYTRDGRDLIVEKSVDLETALSGGVLEIESPDGRAVDLPAAGGLYPGQRLGVAGRGFPSPTTDERGDLIVVIDVRSPADLAPDERRLVAQWLDQARITRGQVSPALVASVRRVIRKKA